MFRNVVNMVTEMGMECVAEFEKRLEQGVYENAE